MAERLYIQNRRKRQQRKRQLRLAGKLALVMLGCALFLFLIGRTVVKLVTPEKEKEEEYITLQEAGNLAWLLADTAAGAGGGADAQPAEDAAAGQSASLKAAADEILAKLKAMDASEGDGYLTYGQAQVLQAFFPDAEASLWEKGKQKEKLPAGSWYAWYDAARRLYDPQGRIEDLTVTILGVGGAVQKSDGTSLLEQQLVTTQGEKTFFAQTFTQSRLTGCSVTALGREDGLYAVRSVGGEAFTLSNAWTVQADEKTLICFWNEYEIDFSKAAFGESGGEPHSMPKGLDEGTAKKEVIADITFQSGRLTEIRFKENKVSGRLLKVADGGAEIEGQGFFSFSDDMRSYRLYGRMKTLSVSELRIGYAFTDFVVEDGRIEAALVPREEKMEYIRVLVKTSNYGSAYHDSLKLQADCDCTVISGEYGSTKETKLLAGEILTVDKEHELFAAGERIWIRPDILTGHISLLNVERSQKTASYRGSFELIKSPDGIVAVNEVLLEEYLYAVVPSEMPASYPLEALKSQAICARTYAYAKMCRAGLPAYGAHVDDSTGFQVYQNISENMETTRAVKETKGQTLYYGEELAEAYYYSTSCGYGADAGVWMNGSAEKYPYLVSQKIGQGDHFYEEEEPWYRWQYEVEKLDPDVLRRAVLKRYEANAGSVLVKQADGSFVSQKPPETGRIREISVALYGAGGVAQQLLIEGEKATLLVETENSIRHVLCDGNAQAVRQDGSSVNVSSMVPSAFFTINTLKENGFVVGYTLSGGGFGHGVGLSQNGARNMAAAGYTSDEILSFFYKGCILREIY